jgi:hypothetical protein
MKNKRNLYWLLLILAAIILFATNPSEAQFKEYLKEEARTELKSQETVEGKLSQIVSGAATRLAGMATKRKEFYLFSTYEIAVPGTRYAYVGIFNNFFPIRKK